MRHMTSVTVHHHKAVHRLVLTDFWLGSGQESEKLKRAMSKLG